MVDRQLSKVDRPQTLKQAKRAYNKQCARPKLNARELALAERRIQLQQRADQIRDKEARKKANAKKRVEKKEKERAALIRQGKEIPKEGGFKVGASQMELTKFLPKTSTEEDCDEKSLNEGLMNRLGQKKMGSSQDSNRGCILASNDEPGCRGTDAEDRKAEPQDNSHKAAPVTSTSSQKSPRASDSRSNVDDQFMDWLPSNTQIERELSPFTPQTAVHIDHPRYRITVSGPADASSTSDSAVLQNPRDSRQKVATWISNPSYHTSEPHPTRSRLRTTTKADSGYATKQDTPCFGPSKYLDPALPTIDDFDLSSEELEAIVHQCTQSHRSSGTEPNTKAAKPKESSSFDYDGFADDELSELNAMADKVELAAAKNRPPRLSP